MSAVSILISNPINNAHHHANQQQQRFQCPGWNRRRYCGGGSKLIKNFCLGGASCIANSGGSNNNNNATATQGGGDHRDDQDDVIATQRKDYYDKLLNMHRIIVDRIEEDKNKTINPFAKANQDNFSKLGGFHPIDFADRENQSPLLEPPIRLHDRLHLPDKKVPVTVLDNVLPASWCAYMIDLTTRIGYGTPPELKPRPIEASPPKNSSQLVQIHSHELADYLWKHLSKYVPMYQTDIPTKGVIKVFEEKGKVKSPVVYEKRNIIPVFRFQRYQSGQGFRVHEDPERLYANYPCTTTIVEGGKSTRGGGPQIKVIKKGDEGIFRSLFTLAIYLNDVEDFGGGNGGVLNFVKKYDQHHHRRQASGVGGSSGGRSTGNNNATTNYYSSNDHEYESLAKVVPEIGRSVIFRHDELHEGGGIAEGTKYMIQCDILYERVFN